MERGRWREDVVVARGRRRGDTRVRLSQECKKSRSGPPSFITCTVNHRLDKSLSSHAVLFHRDPSHVDDRSSGPSRQTFLERRKLTLLLVQAAASRPARRADDIAMTCRIDNQTPFTVYGMSTHVASGFVEGRPIRINSTAKASFFLKRRALEQASGGMALRLVVPSGKGFDCAIARRHSIRSPQTTELTGDLTSRAS